MDAELKAMMEKVQRELGEVGKVKGAVAQIEDQLRGIPKTIENRIAAVRATAWDARGNYRGVLGSEAEARGLGLYVMSTVGRDARAAAALKGEFSDVYQRAMGDDPDSSMMVPIEFSDRIQRLVEESGVYGRLAFNQPMSSDSLTFQRRVRGARVFKVGHGQPATESDPGFETVNLNTSEWASMVLYPKAMGDDAAASVGELVALEIGTAFAEQLDESGLVGDGTPDSLDVRGVVTRLRQINGVGGGAGLVLASGAAGSGWGGIEEDDLLKVMGQVRFVRGGGRWLCSNQFYWQRVAKIILAKGGVTAAEFEGARRLTIFGAPVEITPTMPRASGNSQVAAIFGDLRLSSTLGRRRELTLDESRHTKFAERQVAVLGTARYAPNNHTLGTATEAGPVVGLITPAAS